MEKDVEPAPKEALRGTARRSRYEGHFRPNPDGALRSVTEALQIAARHGIHFDPAEYRVVVDPVPRADYASYFDLGHVAPGSTVPWSRITTRDERILIRLQEHTLASDEAILGALAHEYCETQALKAEYERSGWRISAEHLRRLVESSDISLHNAAWDFADEIIDRLRAEGRAP